MKAPVYSDLNDATESLKKGQVGVIPTDTLYGLVAVAGNEEAVAQLYAVKSREAKPGTLIAHNIDQLVELGIKKRYLTAVERYWPGPVSIVIPVGVALPYLHRGKMSLAIRIPDDSKLQRLLEKTGPLMTSSANHSGKTPAATVQEAIDYFGDKVDFYVDGGNLSDAKPSTIIRIVDDAVEVLREGAISIDEETGKII